MVILTDQLQQLLFTLITKFIAFLDLPSPLIGSRQADEKTRLDELVNRC
jgi:hypothetical protein